MPNDLLASIPIAGIFVLVGFVMLAFYELGFRIAGRHPAAKGDDASSSLGPMVGGLLGMLGFVLAITFSMAAGQHDQRRQGVIDDANTIGTAYLRADLLDGETATQVRQLLREYVDVRLAAVDGNDLQNILTRSDEIQQRLWRLVVAAATAQPNTNTALMVQATNDLIDMHAKRLAAAVRSRIPLSVWVALMLITLLTMSTMGVQTGLTGRRRLNAVVPLSLAFAVLVTLVVDLNRPQGGLIKVSQAAMLDLQASMRGAGQ